MLNCTMPGCRGKINGWTGLDEIKKLMGHFERKHKLVISMEQALEYRIAMEEGRIPVEILANKIAGIGR
jgi:hypothetical protein